MSDNPTYEITFTGYGTRCGLHSEDTVISAVSYALSPRLGQSGDNAKQLVQDAGGYVDVSKKS